MDFFAFFWLFGMTVILPIVLTKLGMDHRLEKLREKVGSPHALDYRSTIEEGISVRELKTLFREVIEETHAPLEDRLEQLEQLRSGAIDEPINDEEEARHTRRVRQ